MNVSDPHISTSKFDVISSVSHLSFNENLFDSSTAEPQYESDLISDMDHMRISGTEPSSVILSQRK